jgi:UDP-N-acetylmuramate dehydrogenase
MRIRFSFAAKFGMEIKADTLLTPYNTFGIKARAKHFIRFASADDLRALFRDPALRQLPRLILGGGSNILFTGDYDGLVLKNEILGIRQVGEDDRHYFIEAGAGENWHDFVMDCIRHNRAGLENLSLIPGNVGASPMQNIGAYGVEVKDRFHELKAFNVETLEVETFDAERCEFGYRDSVFKRQYKGKYIILDVTFRLLKKAELNTSYGSISAELARMGITNPGIADVSKAVIAIRQSKLPDPNVIGNAGSFFKNPIVSEEVFQNLVDRYPGMPHYPAPEGQRKIAAGWLIDKAGWKGFRRRNHGVHAKQALVLVNHGGASGKEIYDLSEEILTDIEKKFGIRLEREVNVV